MLIDTGAQVLVFFKTLLSQFLLRILPKPAQNNFKHFRNRYIAVVCIITVLVRYPEQLVLDCMFYVVE